MKKQTLRRILILLPLLATGFAMIPLFFGDDDRTRSQRSDRSAPATTAPQRAPLNTPEATLIITNGTVIDGTGGNPIQDGAVLIHDNEIVAVGPASDFSVSPNVAVIDANGGAIMPGIINAHVHNTHTPGTRRRFLEAGVTTTCDMASTLDDMPQFDQTLTNENQAAARGFSSGPMITAPEGYPATHGFHWDYEVAGPDEARTAVADLANAGADMVKIALEPWQPDTPWPVLGLAEVRAAVEAAHAAGLPVRAHVQQAAMLDLALEAGVDAVEHVPLPFAEETKLSQLAADEPLSLAAYPALEAQLAQMARQDVSLVPTLSVGTCATRGFAGLESAAQRAMCDFQLEIVGRFYEMGGTIALGNDYGNPGVERGMPLREMDLLQEAGLPPMAVLEAGTRHAAQVCGHGDEVGTLTPGQLADVIIVAGNPLENLAALDAVQLVVKDGAVAHRSEEAGL